MTQGEKKENWWEKWDEIYKIWWGKNKLIKKELQRHKNAIQNFE